MDLSGSCWESNVVVVVLDLNLNLLYLNLIKTEQENSLSKTCNLCKVGQIGRFASFELLLRVSSALAFGRNGPNIYTKNDLLLVVIGQLKSKVSVAISHFSEIGRLFLVTLDCCSTSNAIAVGKLNVSNNFL